MSLTLIILSIIVGLLTYMYSSARKRLKYWQSLGIACEEPNLFLGNITGVQLTRGFSEIWMSYYNRFKGTGPFAGFYWFQRPAVFVLEMELVKNILIKDFHKFTDRGFFANPRDDPLTGQLFLLDGQKWKNMRYKLSPAFTSGKMKYMFPTVVKVGRQFVSVFETMVQQTDIVDVKDLLSRFTMDVIGTCAFGIECNSLNNPQAEFLLMARRAFVETRFGQLGIAFFGSFPDVARNLRLKQTPEAIESFFMGIVRDTVAYREKNNIRRNDFMDMLIDLKNNKTMKSQNGEHLTSLTLEEIAAQAFVFLIAGYETSSTTMGFALYELAQHEDIQQKAREEIISVMQKEQGFTYESLKELQYLDQIISETLRLYTVLPVLNRLCLENYIVPDQPKFVIKKGMPVLIPAGAIHRDPDYYPNPDVFNPDNFSPDEVKLRDSVEWLPFGDGPRNCIGMRFGQMQSRIGLALLLQHFKFSVCSQTPIPMQYDKKNYLLSSEGGIYLKVEKI